MIVIHTYRRINGEFCNIGKGEWVLQTENWVCEVIKEIRLNGVYDLQKELEKKQLEIQQVEDIKNKEMEEKINIEKANNENNLDIYHVINYSLIAMVHIPYHLE